MKFPSLARRRGVLALAATGLVFVAACGGERTDVSAGVQKINDDLLAPQGAALECPKEIDGGEGAEFECTLKATEGDASSKVKMKVTKQGDALAVDVADQAAFSKALAGIIGGGTEQAAPEEEVAPAE
jgi:hypothetical protein